MLCVSCEGPSREEELASKSASSFSRYYIEMYSSGDGEFGLVPDDWVLLSLQEKLRG